MTEDELREWANRGDVDCDGDLCIYRPNFQWFTVTEMKAALQELFKTLQVARWAGG